MSEAVCGQSATARSLGITPDRLGGCGEEITTCVEVYRCVDCDVPFHRSCARRHFATSDEKGPTDCRTGERFAMTRIYGCWCGCGQRFTCSQEHKRGVDNTRWCPRCGQSYATKRSDGGYSVGGPGAKFVELEPNEVEQ